VADIEALVSRETPAVSCQLGAAFKVTVWSQPVLGKKTLWYQDDLSWEVAKLQARGWMQVRHCLAHGLASGWGTEAWPGPVRKDVPPAATVLLPAKSGKGHSLVLHGAISCARIYRAAAEHIADAVAHHLAEDLNWSAVPDFPLEQEAGWWRVHHPWPGMDCEMRLQGLCEPRWGSRPGETIPQ
jgi:hypothetical protein